MRLHTLRSRAIVLLLAVIALTTGTAPAQSVSLGADVVSRYVWRGLDFGQSAAIQPKLAVTTGPATIGTWGSYSVSQDGAGANEHDLYLSFAIDRFSFGVTDYYFPNLDVDPENPVETSDFFNFDGDGEGSHWIEPFVGFTGPETFPISLYAGMFVHNDVDNSVYLEAKYPFLVGGTTLTALAGVVPMESAFYGTDGAALAQVGLSASRAIPLTDQFALPVFVSYVLNPETERTFLVFGLSL